MNNDKPVYNFLEAFYIYVQRRERDGVAWGDEQELIALFNAAVDARIVLREQEKSQLDAINSYNVINAVE